MIDRPNGFACRVSRSFHRLVGCVSLCRRLVTVVVGAGASSSSTMVVEERPPDKGVR